MVSLFVRARVSHPDMSALNTGAYLNMPYIVVTFFTFQLPIPMFPPPLVPVNLLQTLVAPAEALSPNMNSMVVTSATFHELRSPSNADAPTNVYLILVTFAVFQPLIPLAPLAELPRVPVNANAFWNMLSMEVTDEVSHFERSGLKRPSFVTSLLDVQYEVNNLMSETMPTFQFAIGP